MVGKRHDRCVLSGAGTMDLVIPTLSGSVAGVYRQRPAQLVFCQGSA